MKLPSLSLTRNQLWYWHSHFHFVWLILEWYIFFYPFPFNLCLYIKFLFFIVGKCLFFTCFMFVFQSITSVFSLLCLDHLHLMWLLCIFYLSHLVLHPFSSFLPYCGLVAYFLFHFIFSMDLSVTSPFKYFLWLLFWFTIYITSLLQSTCRSYYTILHKV